MRLWSLSLSYLDSKGLVALWREGLLAQKVLQGLTKGYKNHSQLDRFKKLSNPANGVSCYLSHVADEADRRNYNFNRSKIAPFDPVMLCVTTDQLDYEFAHLMNKLKTRDPERCESLKTLVSPSAHPIFNIISGPVAKWEKV